MEKLRREELPKDYRYYRSHSETYFSWIARHAEKHGVRTVFEDGFYGLVAPVFGKWLWTASFEKGDFEPTREVLEKYGFERWWAMWSPLRKPKPEGKGWWKLPSFAAHFFHHSTRSAFSVLDTAEYWKKWGVGPRGHRNKIRKRVASGEIRIDTDAPLEAFLEAYRKTSVPHGWKKYLIARQEFLSGRKDGNIRTFLAYVGDEPLAWAVFLDDAPTSTYLIAFQDAKAKPYHLGLAIVDRWFEDSLAKGFEYLDFDHMRGRFDPASYDGYTEFKSGIADYDVRFEDVWIRFFRKKGEPRIP